MKCYRTTGNEPGTSFRRVTFLQKKSFLALKSKDSEKGETANHCIADTVRWEVRVFAVKPNTPQYRKVDR